MVETMARVLLLLPQQNSRLLLIMIARHEIWMSDTETKIVSFAVSIYIFSLLSKSKKSNRFIFKDRIKFLNL
jgi:hypothetical protein